MSHLLSSNQINSFQNNGYIKVSSFYNQNEINQITNWTNEVQNFEETPGKWQMYYETTQDDKKKRILNRIENFEPYHKGFKNLFKSKILNSVEKLFGSPAVLFKDKINFKMPGGSGFKAHQDIQAGWDKYCKLHMTALISIDAATENNGCLEIASGKHLNKMIGKSWEPLDESSLNYKSFPTKPGDVIFFDSYCPHKSKKNNTNKSRRVLYITFNKLKEGDFRRKYFDDKRKNYPQDCERDPKKKYEFLV